MSQIITRSRAKQMSESAIPSLSCTQNDPPIDHQNIVPDHDRTTKTSNTSRSSKTIRSKRSIARAKEKIELEIKLANLKLKELEFKEQKEILEIELEEKSLSGRRSVCTNTSIKSWLDENEKYHNEHEQHLNELEVEERDGSLKNCKSDNIAEYRSDFKLLAKELGKLCKNGSSDKRLPIFFGDIREWLPFKAAFNETKYYFTDTENINRLRLCLKGEARETVASLLYCQVQSAEIITTLEQRFGRPEIILLEEIRSIKEFPKLNESNEQLSRLACKVKNCVATIKALNKPEHLYNIELVHTLKTKIINLKTRWLHYATEHEHNPEPELVKLSDFLQKEANCTTKYWLLDTNYSYLQKNNRYYENRNRRTYNNICCIEEEPEEDEYGKEDELNTNCYTNTKFRPEPLNCPYCSSKEHKTVYECDKFKELNIDKRWNWAKETKFCFKCLKSKHRREFCKAKNCGKDGCRMSHSILLHGTPELQILEVTDMTKPEAEKEINKNVSNTNTINKIELPDDTVACGSELLPRILLKIIPVTLIGSKERINTYALLDGGSTLTLLKEEIAEKIGLDSKVEPLVLCGINGRNVETNSKKVSFNIVGSSQKELKLYNARTVKTLSLASQSIHNIKQYEHFKNLPIEDLCYVNAQPSLLIGQDNWHVMITSEVKMGRRNEPVASLTPLGWVVHGFSSVTRPIYFVAHADEELNSMVEDYFKIESLGISVHNKVSKENERALNILKTTARRIKDEKRWEVGLLWKEDEVKMPNNYYNVSKRLKVLEKRMDVDHKFGETYVKNMNNFFENGYAGLCEPSNSIMKWYLPHFGVTNINKPDKLRIVFDAAAKTNGTCLNNKLLTGPDLLLSLLSILFKFREGKIAISADIKEMFLQVRVREKDRVSQRFLWRGFDRKGPIEEFEMKSVIFGAACSPTIATYIKNRNSEDFKDKYAEAVEAINTRFYVDDYLHSVQTEEEAIKLIKEVSYINNEGGFTLTQWMSNSPTVMQSINPAIRGSNDVDLNFDINVKTLGLRWNPKLDTIGFNANFAKIPKDILDKIYIQPTKRQILKIIMSIFDPLGLIAPIIIQAKILLQQVWRSGIDWDTKLPKAETEIWNKWLDKLKLTWTCQIPRCYEIEDTYAKIELHTFSDSSEKAFAAVSYWRMILSNGVIRVSLIDSKSRVAPLKPLSIPRLELQAALLGSRLATSIIKYHDLLKPSQRYFWSDSTTVITWIKSDPRNYKTFVAHRLGEISELTKSNEWKWVPTELNIADDATRQIDALDISHRWFNGPQFLFKDEDKWPSQDNIIIKNMNDTELKENKNIIATITFSNFELPSIDKLPRWLKLIRSTAYILYFIERLKKISFDGLSISHIKKAEELWIRRSQIESFPTEYAQLNENISSLDKTSRLVKFNPFLDKNGILRMRSRIGIITEIDKETIHPIILDGKHKYTKLLTQYHHEQYNHGNTETIVNHLRQRFWILKIRPTIKSVIRTCQICRINKAIPQCVPTGDLPQPRLAHHQRAFMHCGLDYFGPLLVTIGRRKEKRYGVLFTCMTTRAVHIEIAGSLSTDSAILALRRLMARRGCPKCIYSDNGTNFHGAETELKNAIKELDNHEIKTFLLNKNIEWKFIPPVSPNMGGCWERLIQSVKKSLYATMKEQAPSEEILCTLLIEAEHIINSRPLTHVSIEPNDPEALTPNHFILGSSSGVPLPGLFDNLDLLRRKDWRRTQRLVDIFWKRWIKEYLPTLSPRYSAGDKQRDLQIGDVVVIVDQNLPRNVWPKGIIENIFMGPDGRIRVADVRTTAGILRRPSIKLVRLPIQDNNIE